MVGSKFWKLKMLKIGRIYSYWWKTIKKNKYIYIYIYIYSQRKKKEKFMLKIMDKRKKKRKWGKVWSQKKMVIR